MKLTGRNMRSIIVILLSACVIGYSASVFMSDTVKVNLGDDTFEIPKVNSRQGSMPSWIANLPGLDDGSKAFVLEFSAEGLSEAAPGYQVRDGDYIEVIRAVLHVLEPYEVARYEDPDRYRDLWEKANSGKEEVIEAHHVDGWYKIYPRTSSRNWSVVRQLPRLGGGAPKDPLDFWVADCRYSNSPVTETGMRERCLTYIFYDDIAVEFYVSGQNLHLIDEIRDHLRERVESWRVKS
ncbi:hypothetical protein [Billgrantia sp. C5P2]|uniref:hypothetical protein n=1 Tax=Billgrantia sp. C5P2 TaxID=3436239 RepID=UPI003DA36A90